MTNRKSLQYYLFTVIIIIAGFSSLWYYQKNHPISSPVATPTIQISNDPKLITYSGITGKTALAILQDKATVSLKQYSFGPMVTGINGLEATANQGWVFYINGTAASMGANDYQTKDGEKIEWKLEELQY